MGSLNIILDQVKLIKNSALKNAGILFSSNDDL